VSSGQGSNEASGYCRKSDTDQSKRGPQRPYRRPSDTPLRIDAAPQPLDKDVVAPSSLPSMLIVISFLSSTLVKSWLVN
jgi:hypothetical protein